MTKMYSLIVMEAVVSNQGVVRTILPSKVSVVLLVSDDSMT